MKSTPRIGAIAAALLMLSTAASASNQALLEVLLENGVITQAQFGTLMEKETITSGDVAAIEAVVDKRIEETTPVTSDYGSGGFVPIRGTATSRPTCSGARRCVTAIRSVPIPASSAASPTRPRRASSRGACA